MRLTLFFFFQNAKRKGLSVCLDVCLCVMSLDLCLCVCVDASDSTWILRFFTDSARFSLTLPLSEPCGQFKTPEMSKTYDSSVYASVDASTNQSPLFVIATSSS
jgi:hypothetical protein